LSRNRFVFLVGLLLSFLSLPRAFAGNLDGVIASEYPDKILTLRHFYGSERLHLYGDGALVDDAPAGTWASDAQIEVRDASQNGSVLTIKARRIYQVYDSKRKEFVDALTLIPINPSKQEREAEKGLKKRQVEIRIEMPPNPDPKEIPETLHAVFLAPGEPVGNIAPPYYRDFFAKREGRATSQQLPAGVFRLASVGSKAGDITAPKATSRTDPEYSEIARQLKLTGTAILSLVVDVSGSVRDIQVVQPLGAGLDEKAIAAVSQWKFDPATKDGKPVPVAISVEVDFRIR
jgi:TonB family protein